MARLLLVDDDVGLTDLLADYLETEHFEVAVARDGRTGTEMALSGRFDFVVLDIMMPGQTGLDTLRQIRAASTIPVLMLTGRGDDLDRILGLELGADDYVAKPCSPREIVARVRAILKRMRSADPSAAVIHVAGLAVKPGQRRAELNGRALALTSTEYSLLEILVRHRGTVVGRDQLSYLALGRPLARFDRSVDVHISGLRSKLGPRADGQPWIKTVVRHGYLFVAG